MEIDQAEDHTRFVRLDSAAITLLGFIAGVYLSFTGDFELGLQLFTVGFVLVGISVAWEWRRELIEHDFVEFEPLASILTGGIVIAIIQIASGLYLLELHFFWAVIYGVLFGLVYDLCILAITFFRLPGEEYKTTDHPKRDDNRKYVFESFYHIGLVEEEALKRSKEQ